MKFPAQVNKLYVYNNYTFIQFVPNDTRSIPDIRPDNLEAYTWKRDGAGYYYYDKLGYYNDDYHQSFVIENTTGNIYSLKDNIYIESVHNGLLKIKGSKFIWDCRINANDELEIFTLFQNETVTVYDYYKDKYGNNYILNDKFNIKDGNTIFTNKQEYHVALNTNEVVFIEGVSLNSIELTSNLNNEPSTYFSPYAYFIDNAGLVDDGLYIWGDQYMLWENPGDDYHRVWSAHEYSASTFYSITQIRIMGENCTPRFITEDDYLEFRGFETEYSGNVSHIENKKMFSRGGHVIDTDTGNIKKAVIFDEGNYITRSFFTHSFRFNKYLIEDTLNKKLYYYKVNFDTLPDGNNVFRTISDFGDSLELLFEGFDDKPAYYIPQWTVSTINSQDTYTVYWEDKNGEKTPIVKKIGEYTAGGQQVVTLKPINR